MAAKPVLAAILRGAQARAPQDDGEGASRAGLSDIRKPRRTLFHVRANRLKLIEAAHQLHLLDGFSEQRRAWIDRQIVEHALGGADRFGALAGDLARDFEGGSARVIANPRGEAIAQRLLRRED